VLHYVEHWLDLSAGFVHAHVSRSRHRAVVVSHNKTANRTAFPHRPVHRLDLLHTLVPEHRWPQTRTTALRSLATVHRARLVHVHFGYVVGDVLGLTRRSGLPLVLSLHGDDATSLPTRQPGHYDDTVAAAAAVVVPSRFLAGVATGLGFAPDRVHVIPAGVDTGFFTPSPVPRTPRVTFVGRLVEKKGLDVLLSAWPAVVAEVPEARLDIIGAGPLAAAIPAGERSVRHVAPEAHRRGEQVRDAVRSARVVVSPSRVSATGDAESLLLVNLEAQASGRPVVTTRHGGIPEFVDERTAVLVPEGDAPALAQAVARLLADPATAQEMGRAGPSVAARFSAEAGTAGVDAVYADLLRNTHH
jgi:glycosyltransferase involved in cell wall biosynthesis